ncbi:hypothetical protein [Mesobacillus zeae]|uniref:hypothetical protein n=1 Tax=Mesobacillus zeae TaxID=1917180 RepID=UPI0030093D03
MGVGNIEIVLKSDCTHGSGDNFRMSFDLSDKDEIRITTTNAKDGTQHDFAMTKEEYTFLRKQFDKHLKMEAE